MAPPEKKIDGPLHLRTESPQETIALARALGRLCRAGDVICLQGTLGAGKTHFVKGLAVGLGVETTEEVTSPTFVLLNRYRGRLTISHVDAYRLESAEEMEEIGCDEIFEEGGVSVIEWADHVARCLPPRHFLVTIRIRGEKRRDILLGAVGAEMQHRMDDIAAALSRWLGRSK